MVFQLNILVSYGMFSYMQYCRILELKIYSKTIGNLSPLRLPVPKLTNKIVAIQNIYNRTHV